MPDDRRIEDSTLYRGIEALVREHEGSQRYHRGGDLVARARGVLAHYQDLAASHLAGCDNFRHDLLGYFRALVLVAESVGNTASHHWKDIRVAGLIEMLESAIKRLRDWRLDESFTSFAQPDLWRSDYPVRELVRRNRELQDRVKQLEEERLPRVVAEPPPPAEAPF
jgi:hypothetical protein